MVIILTYYKDLFYGMNNVSLNFWSGQASSRQWELSFSTTHKMLSHLDRECFNWQEDSNARHRWTYFFFSVSFWSCICFKNGLGWFDLSAQCLGHKHGQNMCLTSLPYSLSTHFHSPLSTAVVCVLRGAAHYYHWVKSLFELHTFGFAVVSFRCFISWGFVRYESAEGRSKSVLLLI